MNYCKNLDKEKFDITIFASNPIAEKHRLSCIENGIKLEVVPSKNNDGLLKYILFLLKRLSKKNFDIVHVHGNSATIICELLIAKIKGIKVRISHSHNTTCDHKIIHKLLQPLLCSLSTLKYACGIDAGKWMYGKKDFKVIPNGFLVDNFKFNQYNRKIIREKLNVDDKIVIGHVGIFTEQKNHNFIIEVFESIAEQDERYVLLLVGAGPKYNEIKEKICKSKYKERIILYGESNNVKELYDAMDIFLLPSKYEGLVVVLLEAQVEGLKCIVSDKVSEEGFFNSEVLSISLDESIQKWKEIIMNTQINSIKQRKDFLKNNLVSVKKYDIKNNVLSLEKEYLDKIASIKSFK